MKKWLGAGLLVAAVALLPAARTSEALNIVPGDADWSGDANSNPGALAEAEAACPGTCLTTEVYKQNVGGGEEGSLAGSYSTVFLDTPLDPSGATISYTGGPTVAGQTYLFVKDGAHSPAWYLFDLGVVPAGIWNGTETLNLSGFWPNGGAISHVSLFSGTGTPPTDVPEPASLSLLFLGLAAVGAASRKSKVS
jgi:hypothetical protein